MEAHYYQQTSVVRCGFCFDPLTQEKLKMYQDLKKVWTTVIPSCGDKQCLALAPGKEFGFITKRKIKKKKIRTKSNKNMKQRKKNLRQERRGKKKKKKKMVKNVPEKKGRLDRQISL